MPDTRFVIPHERAAMGLLFFGGCSTKYLTFNAARCPEIMNNTKVNPATIPATAAANL
jgi:hypothetical protein